MALPNEFHAPRFARLRTIYEPRRGGMIFLIEGEGHCIDGNGAYHGNIEMYARLDWHLLRRGEDTLIDGALIVEKAMLQETMDDIWNAGIRPSGFADLNPFIAELKDQIRDLRKLRDKLLAKILKRDTKFWEDVYAIMCGRHES